MSLRVINNLADLKEIKTFWETLQINPNSDYDLFQLVCRSRKAVRNPYVIVLERNGIPCGILCARMEDTFFKPRFGYFSPFKIRAVALTVIHEGLLGEFDSEAAREVLEHLWSLLLSGKVEAVTFHFLSEGSPLMAALLDRAPACWCDKEPAWSTHRSMEIGNEPGFLLSALTRKHRSVLRKKQRLLESEFPGEVLWKWMSSFEDISKLCAGLERVAARTYQRGLGAGFVDDAEYRSKLKLFADLGQLRVQVMEIQGMPRAYWIGTVHRGVFHAWATAYDPDLQEYSPGTLVFSHLVDELVKEGVHKLDFGLEDAYYKQRYGDKSWREATVTIFAPSLKGFALRSTLGFCAVADNLSRRFLEKTGLMDRVKTGWRKHLSNG